MKNKNSKRLYKGASRVYLQREFSRINLENQGIKIIKIFLDNLEKNKLVTNLIFIMVEMLAIIIILFFHTKAVIVSLMVVFLLLTFLSHTLYSLVVNFLTHHSRLVRLFSITILVLRRGVSNLDPAIVTLTGWYGWVARRKVESSISSKSELETFNSLLPEWQGSLDELLSASKSL